MSAGCFGVTIKLGNGRMSEFEIKFQVVMEKPKIEL